MKLSRKWSNKYSNQTECYLAKKFEMNLAKVRLLWSNWPVFFIEVRRYTFISPQNFIKCSALLECKQISKEKCSFWGQYLLSCCSCFTFKLLHTLVWKTRIFKCRASLKKIIYRNSDSDLFMQNFPDLQKHNFFLKMVKISFCYLPCFEVNIFFKE